MAIHYVCQFEGTVIRFCIQLSLRQFIWRSSFNSQAIIIMAITQLKIVPMSMELIEVNVYCLTSTVTGFFNDTVPFLVIIFMHV